MLEPLSTIRNPIITWTLISYLLTFTLGFLSCIAVSYLGHKYICKHKTTEEEVENYRDKHW